MQVNPRRPSAVPLAVLGAAMGLIVALVCVAAFSMTGFSVNAGVVGSAAGAIAGAATALLGATDQSD